MNRYVVTLEASYSRAVSVEAETPEDAVLAAERQRPRVLTCDRVELRAQWVEKVGRAGAQNVGGDVIGRCEGCSRVLVEPVDHPLDFAAKRLSVAVGLPEGGYLCRPCADAMQEHHARHAGNGGDA